MFSNSYSKFKVIIFLFVLVLGFSSCSKVDEPIVLDPSSLVESTTTMTETTEETAVTTPEVEPAKIVKFMGIGDNLIHPPLYYCADYNKGEYGDGEYDFSYLFEAIKEDIEAADIRFINAETISGGDELGMSGYPSFNSPTQLIYDTVDAGFNLVNLANNHCIDMGPRGVIHARYRWDKTDCITSGINVDQKDRDTYRIFTVNDVKFGFISYTSHTNSIPADQDWRVNYMEEEAIRRDLPALRSKVDFLIVSAHWGWDDIFRIDDFQRSYAELFAELDVDLVVGTGPHVLQKIEWLENNDHKTLVAFSLGNYASGMHGAFNEIAGILKLDFIIDQGERSIENVSFVPTVMHLSNDDKKHMVYKLSYYNEELASKHKLRSMTVDLNMDYFIRVLNEQIDSQYLPEEFISN